MGSCRQPGCVARGLEERNWTVSDKVWNKGMGMDIWQWAKCEDLCHTLTPLRSVHHGRGTEYKVDKMHQTAALPPPELAEGITHYHI